MSISRSLILMTVFFAGLLPAQHFKFRTYGRQEGLSSPAIRCILQDRIGFLWVGTNNGLFRYDGARFSRFGKSEGLPDSRIAALHETADPKGSARSRDSALDWGDGRSAAGQPCRWAMTRSFASRRMKCVTS